MSLSLKKQSTRTKQSSNQTHQINQNHPQEKPHRKYQQILQLKEELIKMKNFLHHELPEINQLLPQRTCARESSVANFHQPCTEDVARILDLNRRLFQQKQQLEEELTKERSLKKALSKSLKKQQRMVTELYSTSHQKFLTRPQETQKLSRNGSKQRQLKAAVSMAGIDSLSKKSEKTSRSIEKSGLWANNKQPKLASSKFNTETSITRMLDNQKDKAVKQTAPCYSTSQQEIISNLQQVGSLEKKMQDLIKESQKMQNRTKKLLLRNQMERVANRLNCLKGSLGKPV